MDDQIETSLRALVAHQLAHGFLIECLLKQSFIQLSKPQRLELAEAMLDASVKTQHYMGRAKDDFQAERLADIVIQAQQIVDRAIGAVLTATENAEGSKFEPKTEAD